VSTKKQKKSTVNKSSTSFKNMGPYKLLPNGCKCSKLSVHPSDWRTTKTLNGEWYLDFRFTEPGYPPKQRRIKLNRLSTLAERKKLMDGVIKLIEKRLNEGNNYRTLSGDTKKKRLSNLALK
jgi:hypothetical protein